MVLASLHQPEVPQSGDGRRNLPTLTRQDIACPTTRARKLSGDSSVSAQGAAREFAQRLFGIQRLFPLFPARPARAPEEAETSLPS